MHKKFQVRAHNWDKGVLETKDHFFSTKEEAISFSQRHSCDMTKVLDEDKRVVYQQRNSAAVRKAGPAERIGIRHKIDFETYS